MRRDLSSCLNLSIDGDVFISSGISFHTCAPCTFILHLKSMFRYTKIICMPCMAMECAVYIEKFRYISGIFLWTHWYMKIPIGFISSWASWALPPLGIFPSRVSMKVETLNYQLKLLCMLTSGGLTHKAPIQDGHQTVNYGIILLSISAPTSGFES